MFYLNSKIVKLIKSTFEKSDVCCVGDTSSFNEHYNEIKFKHRIMTAHNYALPFLQTCFKSTPFVRTHFPRTNINVFD